VKHLWGRVFKKQDLIFDPWPSSYKHISITFLLVLRFVFLKIPNVFSDLYMYGEEIMFKTLKAVSVFWKEGWSSQLLGLLLNKLCVGG
jgi:hypothetical protein